MTLDRAALVDIWAAFDPALINESYYAAEIRDLVAQHEELSKYSGGAPTPGADIYSVVMLDAWGVTRPAMLKWHHLVVHAFAPQRHKALLRVHQVGLARDAGDSACACPSSARRVETLQGIRPAP